jgi:hypothetical protein
VIHTLSQLPALGYCAAFGFVSFIVSVLMMGLHNIAANGSNLQWIARVYSALAGKALVLSLVAFPVLAALNLLRLVGLL